jgi:phosphoglycolate phosphatase-like HAD superfamily hydrolase
MPNEGTHESRIKQTRAILFDLHHTITKTRTDIISWCRITSKNAGVDLSKFSDEQIQNAFNASNEFMKSHLEDNQADIHWGNDPDDWREINRIFFDHLKLTDVTSEQIDHFELGWRGTKENAFEFLIDDAKETFEELSERGYILGICTRRHTDPKKLLDRWEIGHLFETVHYSGVPGYAKPSPYTLLKSCKCRCRGIDTC